MHLHIVTPHGKAFEGKVEAVTLPGVKGQMTVLPGHAMLISALERGRVVVRDAGGRQHFRSGDGFVEVQHNTVTVLVSKCEKD